MTVLLSWAVGVPSVVSYVAVLWLRVLLPGLDGITCPQLKQRFLSGPARIILLRLTGFRTEIVVYYSSGELTPIFNTGR